MWWPEGELSRALGSPVRLAAAARPPAPVALTPGERAQWRRLAPGGARRDWLFGRAALKALLRPGDDTSAMSFPHPRLSLTHAGQRAFALRVEGEDVAGAGIDFEPWRTVDGRAGRFFLRPAERADPPALLRLWTVKEALYKATPDNCGFLLLDFEVDDPCARWGTARGPGCTHFRYGSVEMAEGVLSAAVCDRGVRRAAV